MIKTITLRIQSIKNEDILMLIVIEIIIMVMMTIIIVLKICNHKTDTPYP